MELKPKLSEIFDNVLADTETAFQGTGRALACVLPPSSLRSCLHTVMLPLAFLASFVTMAAATIVVFLPSFFTLLILRTTKVETDSAAFGQRQAVILRETCGRKAMRLVAVCRPAAVSPSVCVCVCVCVCV